MYKVLFFVLFFFFFKWPLNLNKISMYVLEVSLRTLFIFTMKSSKTIKRKKNVFRTKNNEIICDFYV